MFVNVKYGLVNSKNKTYMYDIDTRLHFLFFIS